MSFSGLADLMSTIEARHKSRLTPLPPFLRFCRRIEGLYDLVMSTLPRMLIARCGRVDQGAMTAKHLPFCVADLFDPSTQL
jgi:hypothetical protein